MAFMPQRVRFNSGVHGEFGPDGPVEGDTGLLFTETTDLDGDQWWAVTFKDSFLWCKKGWFEIETDK